MQSSRTGYRLIIAMGILFLILHSAGFIVCAKEGSLVVPVTISGKGPAPRPDFSVNATTGSPPLAVRFTDTSVGTNITGWSWDFDGDGIIDSVEQNPVCVYNRPGNYTVNLTVTNAYRSKSVAKPSAIHVNSGAPVAGFAMNRSSGVPPLAVQFADTSVGQNISGWSWDFDGDGTVDSTEKNPVCVYNRPGNYTVNLTVTNAYGTGIPVTPRFVDVNAGLMADFSVNVSDGVPPLAVQFADTSVGQNISGWSWDFDGDGTIDSTEKNPVCVYNKPGDYTVNLTVFSALGSDMVSGPAYITVSNGAIPAFAPNVTSGFAPLAVRFNDTSVGSNITGRSWDFDGDGTIDSVEQNPVCVYNTPGNYTVTFTVSTDKGTNSTARQGLVLVRPAAPLVDFTANATIGVPPLAVQFADTSVGQNISGWAWDFDGDGTIDNTEKNPVCVYNRPGDYPVGLTARGSAGSNVTVKNGYITVTSGEPRARFAVNHTSGPAPFVVQFKDTSVGTNITGRAWDFDGDGTIDSTEQNPVCTYLLSGNYTVRLTSINPSGSNTTVRTGFIAVNDE